MMHKTVTVDVDIDPWEVIEEVEEDELAEYLREGGWFVSKDEDPLTDEDKDILCEMISERTCPTERDYLQLKEIYEKLRKK